MARTPYKELYPNNIFTALKMYERTGAWPLDPSSVFDTVEELQAYIDEEGSYAYPGQVVTVANGTINESNGQTNYTAYVIRSDMSIQSISSVEGQEIDWNSIINIPEGLDTKKNMFNNPEFTGIPIAPTPPTDTQTRQLATTKFVHAAIEASLESNTTMRFKGILNSGDLLPDDAIIGDTYTVGTTGYIAGVRVRAGDMIICTLNTTELNQVDNWVFVQTSIEGAVVGPDVAVSDNFALFDGTTGSIIKDGGFSKTDIISEATSKTIILSETEPTDISVGGIWFEVQPDVVNK